MYDSFIYFTSSLVANYTYIMNILLTVGLNSDMTYIFKHS